MTLTVVLSSPLPDLPPATSPCESELFSVFSRFVGAAVIVMLDGGAPLLLPPFELELVLAEALAWSDPCAFAEALSPPAALAELFDLADA